MHPLLKMRDVYFYIYKLLSDFKVENARLQKSTFKMKILKVSDRSLRKVAEICRARSAEVTIKEITI